MQVTYLPPKNPTTLSKRQQQNPDTQHDITMPSIQSRITRYAKNQENVTPQPEESIS